MKVLKRQDVLACLHPTETLECMHDLFVSYGAPEEERPVVPARTFVSNTTLFMPAHLHSPSAMGIKVVGIHPKNSLLSLPTLPAVVMLSHPDTGVPTGVLNATDMTAFRTAAGS
jgi:alanine dehydrogenase